MIKMFSNTILMYLEADINSFINNTHCKIISINYNSSVIDGEILHNVLLYYTMPKE